MVSQGVGEKSHNALELIIRKMKSPGLHTRVVQPHVSGSRPETCIWVTFFLSSLLNCTFKKKKISRGQEGFSEK